MLKLWLLLIVLKVFSFELPDECKQINKKYHAKLNELTLQPTIEPTISPTIIPTKDTKSPTLTPTFIPEQSCCKAINLKWNNNNGCNVMLRGGNAESCQWDIINNHILRINLKGCQLNNSIPDEFQYFKNIVYIDLSDNNLTSLTPNIWNELSNWNHLSELILTNNSFNSDVPNNIFQYKNITKIDISNNKHFKLNIGSLNLTKTEDINSKTFSFNASNVDVILNGIHDNRFYDLFNNINYVNFSLNNNDIKYEFNNTLCTINVSNTFELYNNSINNTFPLNFRDNNTPIHYIRLSGNNINSTNIPDLSQYTSLVELFLVQNEEAYRSQNRSKTSCYKDYQSYSVLNDWDNYCISKNKYSGLICKGCTNIDNNNNSNESKFSEWISNNIVYIIPLFVGIFSILLFLILRNAFKNRSRPQYNPNNKKMPRNGPGKYRDLSRKSTVHSSLLEVY